MTAVAHKHPWLKQGLLNRISTCAFAIIAAAILSLWPAFYNGFPLLYPDSMTYLDEGRKVAQALFLHRFSTYYGMRSFIYSLGILPWHWNLNPWPILALQSLLTAYVLWLVARSILPKHTEARYLLLFLLLSVLSSLSWYVSLILPDFLGPLLYLSIYLLVFAGETLARGERIAIYFIAWWAVASHATHLLLSAGLSVFLLLIFLFQRPLQRSSLKPLGNVIAIILLAAAAQFALHGYLDGKPSLDGKRPPFLTARIIADGPGRWYLEQHCGQLKWAICSHLNNLSSDPDIFLWDDNGLWQTVPDDEGERIVREEVPFVLATLRAYPLQQLSKSAMNFWGQLTTFGFEDLDPSKWVLNVFDKTMPRARASYMHSRQANNAMPIELFTTIQNWTVLISTVVIAAFTPRLWLRRRYKLLGLSAVIAFSVVGNALISGTMSMVEDRLQSRVVWLVPLLALLIVIEELTGDRAPEKSLTDQDAHLPGEQTHAAKPLAV